MTTHINFGFSIRKGKGKHFFSVPLDTLQKEKEQKIEIFVQKVLKIVGIQCPDLINAKFFIKEKSQSRFRNVTIWNREVYESGYLVIHFENKQKQTTQLQKSPKKPEKDDKTTKIVMALALLLLSAIGGIYKYYGTLNPHSIWKQVTPSMFISRLTSKTSH